MSHAKESLVDRHDFRLDAVQWRAFLAALGSPPRLMPRLERLLKEPGFFDVGAGQ